MHTHLLALGMLVFLIVLALDKVFDLSSTKPGSAERVAARMARIMGEVILIAVVALIPTLIITWIEQRVKRRFGQAGL